MRAPAGHRTLVFDHCGVRTSHRADQAPKPVNRWVVASSRRKLTKNIKQTFFAVGLDNVGFIEAQYEVLG
jgi:hypothetical protein